MFPGETIEPHQSKFSLAAEKELLILPGWEEARLVGLSEAQGRKGLKRKGFTKRGKNMPVWATLQINRDTQG